MIANLSNGLEKASSEIGLLCESMRKEGFSNLMDSVTEIQTKLEGQHNLEKTLLVVGFVILGLLQVGTIVSLIIK